MFGLLGNGWDDPRSAAIMGLSQGLLGGSFQKALMGANQGYAGAMDRQQKGLLAQLQLDEARAKIEDAKRRRDFLQTLPAPGFMAGQAALAGGGGPTIANAARVTPVSPAQDLMFRGVQAGEIPLGEYLKSMQPKGLEFGKVDPKDYTPESLRQAAATGDYTQLVPVRKTDVVNGQAVDLYNTKPGTVFDSVNPNQPFNLRGGQAVPNSAFQQYELGKARAGKTELTVNTGQRGLDNELSIHSKFRQEPIYKAHQDVQSAYQQITAALRQGSPAGDLAGATKIMKILDPGSVVRESELGMAMAATGLLDRAQNYAQMVMSGQKLTPKQRQDFQTLADTLYQESAKQYNAKRGEYAGFATDYGLNADRIVGPSITSPRLPAPGVPAPGGQASPAFPKFLGFESR